MLIRKERIVLVSQTVSIELNGRSDILKYLNRRQTGQEPGKKSRQTNKELAFGVSAAWTQPPIVH